MSIRTVEPIVNERGDVIEAEEDILEVRVFSCKMEAPTGAYAKSMP